MTTVEALGRTREGICDPTDIAPYPGVGNGPIGDDAALARWEPWVRNYLMQGELLGCGFNFEPHPSASSPTGLSLKLGAQTLITMLRPSDTTFERQVQDVLSYAALRQDRSAEILGQIDGQVPFWQSLFPLRMQQVPLTQEIVTAVTQLAVFIEMRFKHDFACRRPGEFSPQVQPMITTPGHGCYPMGHSTQIFAVRSIMELLLTQAFGPMPANLSAQMRAAAYRMSENRVVAGVHFPIDLVGGAVLGERLAAYAFSRFTDSPLLGLENVIVNAEEAFGPGASDFRTYLAAAVKTSSTALTACPSSKVLIRIWKSAVAELQTVGGRTASTSAPVPAPAPDAGSGAGAGVPK
jgi:hypothetical protein